MSVHLDPSSANKSLIDTEIKTIEDDIIRIRNTLYGHRTNNLKWNEEDTSNSENDVPVLIDDEDSDEQDAELQRGYEIQGAVYNIHVIN